MIVEKGVILENESYIDADNLSYTSGQLAEILGINRDSVRYYTNNFSEFLNVEKTKDGKGGHIRYSNEDIEKLKLIISMKNAGKKVKEIKAALTIPGTSFILNDEDKDEAYKELLNQQAQYIIETIKEIYDNKSLPDKALLELKDEIVQEVITNQNAENKQLHNEIASLSDEINKLREQTDKQNQLIEELLIEKTKKRGILGMFKK